MPPPEPRSKVPPGCEEIRAPDRFDPSRSRLLAAKDGEKIYFFRPQDREHYPLPIEECCNPELGGFIRACKTLAGRLGLHWRDVVKKAEVYVRELGKGDPGELPRE